MFPWSRRKKKGKNARQRYDLKYPVLPVRVPASFKDQLASEAASKGIMLSEYARKLLMNLEAREIPVERLVEKVIEVPIVKTVDNPEKDTRIRELKRRLNRLSGILPGYEKEDAQLSESLAHSNDEIQRLKDMLRSVSGKHEALTKDRDARDGETENLQDRLSELSDENDMIREQLDWAINELKSNDARNEKIARIIANDHDIQVRFVTTKWKEMP